MNENATKYRLKHYSKFIQFFSFCGIPNRRKRFCELAFRTAWGALKAAHWRIEWVTGERTMHNRNPRAITGKRIPCWGCWFASLPGCLSCLQTHAFPRNELSPQSVIESVAVAAAAAARIFSSQPSSNPVKNVENDSGGSSFWPLACESVACLYWPWPFRKYARGEVSHLDRARAAPSKANLPGNR